MSCHSDKIEDDTFIFTPSANQNRLFIHVNTVTPFAGTDTSDRVTEKIKSLRVIILSGDYIQVNDLITFDEEMDASTFIYNINEAMIEGEKKFYFIANEESLGTISFQPIQNVSLPPEVNGITSLTDILNLEIFNAIEIPDDGDNDENNSEGTEEGENNENNKSFDTSGWASNAPLLENVLNSIYFLPTYNVIFSNNEDTGNDENSGNNGNVFDYWQPSGIIYLPYSVYYSENDITSKKDYKDSEGKTTGFEATMYLVPVATKFEFHFTNYRSNPVELSDLKVTQFDNNNFLFARVGDSDIKKTFPDEEVTVATYWPDWLEKIAELSWDNITTSDQNNTFNNQYGWISHYSIPNVSSQNPVIFPPNVTPSSITIPAYTKDASGEIISGKLDLGPFYLPESLNIKNSQQWYGLNFTVKDNVTNVEFIFANDDVGSPIAIENIGSLFRDTQVIINVKMNEGEALVEGVYAEIMPYIKREGWGYVGDYVK